VFVDADACPVKQEVLRVAGRYGLAVTLVAGSWMRVPASDRLRLEVVGGGMNAADDWIVERVEADDLVITADIPLAARCLERGAAVLRPTGQPLTLATIGPVLATRDLLDHVRGCGGVTSGPPPFSRRDRSRFLEQLDQAVQAIRRRHGLTDR
jgi:uncharacterized protein YaiI (UPF0178 family)